MSEANPKQLIKFKLARAPYQIGEIAGFPPGTAKRYIDAGFAEDMGPVKPRKPTEEELAKKKDRKKDRKRPKLTKEMVAAARTAGQGGDYITKDGS